MTMKMMKRSAYLGDSKALSTDVKKPEPPDIAESAGNTEAGEPIPTAKRMGTQEGADEKQKYEEQKRLRHYNRYLWYGDAGCGKTHLLGTFHKILKSQGSRGVFIFDFDAGIQKLLHEPETKGHRLRIHRYTRRIP